VGVVSRNNARIVSKYLDLAKDLFEDIKVDLVLANELEIQDNKYTGKGEILVNNSNLGELIQDKLYICGRDEKRILESQGFPPPSFEKGLFMFGNI